MTLLAPVFRTLSHSPFAATRMFGGVFPALRPGDRYFDATTIALRARMKQVLTKGNRVLEIGTGSCATLARWLHVDLGCDVVCTDIDDIGVQRARGRMARERLHMDIEVAEFFGSTTEPLDVVIFNPPYVPTAIGKKLGLSEAMQVQWDGGPEGTTVLEAFLHVLAERETQARIYVGINPVYVKHAVVESLIAGVNNVSLDSAWRHRWSGVDVYELSRSSPADS